MSTGITNPVNTPSGTAEFPSHQHAITDITDLDSVLDTKIDNKIASTEELLSNISALLNASKNILEGQYLTAESANKYYATKESLDLLHNVVKDYIPKIDSLLEKNSTSSEALYVEITGLWKNLEADLKSCIHEVTDISSQVRTQGGTITEHSLELRIQKKQLQDVLELLNKVELIASKAEINAASATATVNDALTGLVTNFTTKLNNLTPQIERHETEIKTKAVTTIVPNAVSITRGSTDQDAFKYTLTFKHQNEDTNTTQTLFETTLDISNDVKAYIGNRFDLDDTRHLQTINALKALESACNAMAGQHPFLIENIKFYYVDPTWVTEHPIITSADILDLDFSQQLILNEKIWTPEELKDKDFYIVFDTTRIINCDKMSIQINEAQNGPIYDSENTHSFSCFRLGFPNYFRSSYILGKTQLIDEQEHLLPLAMGDAYNTFGKYDFTLKAYEDTGAQTVLSASAQTDISIGVNVYYGRQVAEALTEIPEDFTADTRLTFTGEIKWGLTPSDDPQYYYYVVPASLFLDGNKPELVFKTALGYGGFTEVNSIKDDQNNILYYVYRTNYAFYSCPDVLVTIDPIDTLGGTD
jgi:hypothetical protein